MVGFDQCSPHHAFDIYTHTAHVVEASPADLALRWAALLHDVGKVPCQTLDDGGQAHYYGHAQESARMANALLRQLRAPNELRERVVFLVEKHMTWLEPEKKMLRRWLGKYGWEAVEQLLQLQEADMGSKGTGKPETSTYFTRIQDVLREIQEENACLSLKDLAVNGRDLMALGYQGREIGAILNQLLNQVLDEQLPNEKEALLASLNP